MKKPENGLIRITRSSLAHARQSCLQLYRCGGSAPTIVQNRSERSPITGRLYPDFLPKARGARRTGKSLSRISGNLSPNTSGTAPALNARIELAKAFFETKRYGDAIKTGKEALSLAPAGSGLRPLILYQLGYAYESAGKPDEAANEWTSLKQLGMEELEREADWNLGRISEGKKEFARAAEMYQLASQAPGDYPPAALIDQQIARVKAGQ